MKRKSILFSFIIICCLVFSLNYTVINKAANNPSFFAKLEIEKINFVRELEEKNINNSVDKNIIFLNESDYPDIENGSVIIAGHSGTGYNAFFNDLDKLEINDKIVLYYLEDKYIYTIVDIYLNNKTGFISIKNTNKNTIVLTTCYQIIKNKQLVIIGELKKPV